jgi:hypothetical protein
MPWVESISPSFRARHEAADADAADRVLHSLELTRDRLAEVFPRTVGDMTLILHRSTASLVMTNPLLPFAWFLTSPAARRYVAGWAGAGELHVLAPALLEGRASNVAGSREMLELSAAALYARRVIVENNHDLPRSITPKRVRLELRWAWLLEGAARWFSGQTEHSRPAIARRLREGARPRFPPGIRDAPLLGGTLIDLLVREEGELAAAQLSGHFHPKGPRTALAKAFGGRPLDDTEGAWRSHLARMASARSEPGAGVSRH